MKKTFSILAIAAFTLLTVSCSKTIEKKYSEETIKEDLKEIVEKKEADTTDAVIIAMYIVQAKATGEKLEGKTYKEILDKAKQPAERK